MPSLAQVLSWSQGVIDTSATMPGFFLNFVPRLQWLAHLLSAATTANKEVSTLTGMVTQLQGLPSDMLSHDQASSWKIDVLDLHVDTVV